MAWGAVASVHATVAEVLPIPVSVTRGTGLLRGRRSWHLPPAVPPGLARNVAMDENLASSATPELWFAISLIVKKHCTFGCLQTPFPQVTLVFAFPLKVQPGGGERHRVGTGILPAFAQPLVLSFLSARSLTGQLRIPKLETLERMVRLALGVALEACAPMPHTVSSQNLQAKLSTEADRGMVEGGQRASGLVETQPERLALSLPQPQRRPARVPWQCWPMLQPPGRGQTL